MSSALPIVSALMPVLSDRKKTGTTGVSSGTTLAVRGFRHPRLLWADTIRVSPVPRQRRVVGRTEVPGSGDVCTSRFRRPESNVNGAGSRLRTR